MLDFFEFERPNCGDGTVPSWSADLGGLYPNKTYYASDRDHTGALGDDDSIMTEGLVVSNNVIAKIKNIIDDNPDAEVTGITKNRPAYNTNGWTNGVNDQYQTLTFRQDTDIIVTWEDGTMVYSTSTPYCPKNDIVISEDGENIVISLYNGQQVNIHSPKGKTDIRIETFELGESVSAASYELQKGAQMSIAIQ